MKPHFTAVIAALTLTGCNTVGTELEYPSFPVTAAFETPVMASEGDSADDPAIYIGPDGNGFIAGTDKQSGLYIYNLDGSQREYMPVGTINNVDLREGFFYRGQSYVLLVASDDETNSIFSLLYNPRTDKFLTPEGSRLQTEGVSPYGICLGEPVKDKFEVGVTTKVGVFAQYRIAEDQGAITLTKSREFSTGTQTEGCAFDDRTSSLYLAVELGALEHYPASSEAAPVKTEIARVQNYGLKADLEGVTVYERGANTGYLIVSSQGNNSYGVFALPSYEYAGRFEVVNGSVDGTSTTDGIAATGSSTARFPKGFLVVQDDMDNTSPLSDNFKKQNFKIIDWRDIEAQLKK